MLSKDDQTKLIESQLLIAKSLEGIQENLQKLNDQNVLHITEVKSNQNRILEMLQTMTAKYWWLIVVLITVVVGFSGYNNLIKLFTGGV